jgi:catechol 2,3-dioxygenase-like lactoylglutathione lyase family enzyme
VKVGAIRSVTVGVSDIGSALRLFRDVMGLQVESDELADLQEAWRLPPGTRVRLVELSCSGYEFGRLRLAEYEPRATAIVRDEFGGPDSPADIGPKAIDFYVKRDVPMADALRAVAEAGAIPRTRPIRYEVGQLVSEEAVVSGPDEIPMLLMRPIDHPSTSLRVGGPVCRYSEIPTVSVIVDDLERSTAFYEQVLGYERGTDARIRDDLQAVVAELTGVPAETGIHLRLVRDGAEVSGKVLLIRFQGARQKRLVGRMRPGHLGISLYSCQVDGLDELRERLADFGAPILAGPLEVRAGGSARRVLLAEAPDEVVFEFFEAV